MTQDYPHIFLAASKRIPNEVGNGKDEVLRFAFRQALSFTVEKSSSKLMFRFLLISHRPLDIRANIFAG
jgi:hypothetical protein